MTETLNTIETEAWGALEAATLDRDLPYRYLTLASLGRCDFPEARTVVLRSVNPMTRVLEFHTDTHSPKWQDLQQNGDATILGYSNSTRIQLRLRGRIELAFPGSQQAELAWRRLPAHTRTTYTGGPPGDTLPDPGQEPDLAAVSEQSTEGQQCFGVLLFKALSLDWCRLDRQQNLRARFDYTTDGTLDTRTWVAP